MSIIRRSVRRWLLVSMLLIASVACAHPFSGETIDIAKDKKGIGFDDLRYPASLHRVLVAAGRTGAMVLIDPDNHHTSAITGLSAEETYGGGHGEGTTSVDEGEGALFAIDRTSRQVVIIDPVARRVTVRASLAGSPDYVRFVSLAIDSGGGRAFTHLWSGTSLAIDLQSRNIVARWPNQCNGSRGIAYDARSHFLFAACSEGKAVVMDATHDGNVLATASSGSGVDDFRGRCERCVNSTHRHGNGQGRAFA